MKRKGFIIVMCFFLSIGFIELLYAREVRPARPKNLYRLVENKTLKVYLGDIKSESDKISAGKFKGIIKEFLLSRGKEDFVITDKKEEAKVIINADLLDYKYLEDDPVDHIVGGWSGLLIDAAVKQNYARVDVVFSVIRAKDGKRLWHRKYYSTVTQSDMPEPESIPKVLDACCKQFVFLCFGEPKR